VRLNAEDPLRDFRPSPGTITRAVFPAGAGVRVDTHLQAGANVPPYYDSLLAKVIARGGDRDSALHTLRGALGRCGVDGVTTNLELHRALLADAEFAAGGVDTGYLARWLGGAGAVASRPPAPGQGTGTEQAAHVLDQRDDERGRGGGADG
jgi:acetyl-CoA carboxylase biotin carboxylase subunit